MGNRARPAVGKALLAIACAFCVGVPALAGCEEKAGPRYEDFFSLPVRAQREQLRAYSFPEQLEIYEYAMGNRHPPDLGLAEALASNGKPIIPILIERLKKTESEAFQQDLIYVFRLMSDRYYGIRADDQVISVLSRVVSSMKDPFWKRKAEESLCHIVEKRHS